MHIRRVTYTEKEQIFKLKPFLPQEWRKHHSMNIFKIAIDFFYFLFLLFILFYL